MNGVPPSEVWPAGTLLAQLGGDERAELLDLGVLRRSGSGTVLLHQGAPDAHVILIHRGVTKVTCTTADGHSALLAIRTSGEMIGEMAALDGQLRSATVTTCGPCTYSVIGQREFQAFLAGHSKVAVHVAGMVADRLRWANEFRVEFASYPVRVRLARILIKIAQRYGRRTQAGLVIDARLTQPELASMCGAATITIQKVLHDFRRSGLINTSYRRIIVLNPPGLRRAAQLT